MRSKLSASTTECDLATHILWGRQLNLDPCCLGLETFREPPCQAFRLWRNCDLVYHGTGIWTNIEPIVSQLSTSPKGPAGAVSRLNCEPRDGSLSFLLHATSSGAPPTPCSCNLIVCFVLMTGPI
jgi:hypothetical protein